MSWVWFAWVAAPVTDALASASAALPDGTEAGALTVWPAGRKPVADAVRMDARLVDPEGNRCWASLVLVPRGRAPLFDDPAVSGALRSVLSGPPPDAVSTLVRDSSHFAGAVTVRRDRRWLLRDDPFARLASASVLHVAGGLFGRLPATPGPVIQRYAGKPWPAAGF